MPNTTTPTPPKLFLFYLGGKAGHCNIEVHDVQFVACHEVAEAIPILKKNWFGDADKIHIDGYQCLTWVDGHDIALSHEPPQGGSRLYFVNVGAYRADQLAEQHAFGLFAAPDAETAKQKAKAVLLPDLLLQHKDDLYDVDDCLLLSQLGEWHVHLRPNPHGTPEPPQMQGYHPI